MKRKLLLAGFIIGTISNSLFSIFALLNVLSYLQSIQNYMVGIAVISVYTFAMAVCAVSALIFNSICIKLYNKSGVAYNKNKDIIICSIVFNFMPILFFILGLILYYSIEWALVIFLIALVNILANVFIIVDHVKEKKRYPEIYKIYSIEMRNTSNTSGPVKPGEMPRKAEIKYDVAEMSVIKDLGQLRHEKKAQEKLKETSLEGKIKRLEEMYKSGMIDDDDFKKIKQKYIMESIEHK